MFRSLIAASALIAFAAPSFAESPPPLRKCVCEGECPCFGAGYYCGGDKPCPVKYDGQRVAAPEEPPPLRQRVETLEAKVERIERTLFPKSSVSLPAPRAVAPVRSAVTHTHTCARGHTWDHSMDGGSHNCPFCGLHQTVVDPVSKPVQAVQSVAVQMPVQMPVQADPNATMRYSITNSSMSSGCTGPGCSAGGASYGRASSGNGKWYLGKNLGR